MEIAELFGTLSYSAVAKISQRVSKQLGGDNGFRELIISLLLKYSFFKTPFFYLSYILRFGKYFTCSRLLLGISGGPKV